MGWWGRTALLMGSRGRQTIIGLTLFILAIVSGMGWFQYQQIERVTHSEALGYDNFVWEFYQLELHFLSYQAALRESVAAPSNAAKLEETSNLYNIFASQILLIDKSTTADTLRNQAVLQETVRLSTEYLSLADPLLESAPKRMALAPLQALLSQSIGLHAQVHRLVLAAHEFQSQRSSTKLDEIRQFALYGGVISAFLLLLSLFSGLLAVQQLSKSVRRQEQLEQLHLESSHRAAHDPLTDLFNRSEFEKHLRRSLDHSRRSAAMHALMFIDLDRFKIVNDTCGHAAGDQLLRELVGVISSRVRSTDVFGRLGGDEFGLVLTNCSPIKAASVAEEIRSAVDAYRFDFDGHRFHISASVGWVQVHAGWADIAAILQAADSACYVAKNSGRNRVHAFEDDDAAVQTKRTETLWAQRIEEALERDRFELHWQKIVPLQELGPHDGHGIRCEILLRMMDTDGTLLSPAAFIPVAEKFFLASRIDMWVIRNVLSWMAAHPAHMEQLTMLSINLSGLSVGDSNFRTQALHMLDASGVDCHKLCFEVTETAVITHIEDCIPFLSELRARGATIALDDFGCGSSSFSYLKALPADELKIDGKFVQSFLRDQVDRVSVRYMAELAKANNMVTVAEWVDAPTMAQALTDFGVNFGQGYLFHKPESLASLTELLGDNLSP